MRFFFCSTEEGVLQPALVSAETFAPALRSSYVQSSKGLFAFNLSQPPHSAVLTLNTARPSQAPRPRTSPLKPVRLTSCLLLPLFCRPSLFTRGRG